MKGISISIIFACVAITIIGFSENIIGHNIIYNCAHAAAIKHSGGHR